MWWQLIPNPDYLEEGPNAGWSDDHIYVVPSTSGAGHPPKIRLNKIEHKVMWDWGSMTPAFQGKMAKKAGRFMPGRKKKGVKTRYRVDQSGGAPYTVTLQCGASFGNHKTVLSLRQEISRR